MSMADAKKFIEFIDKEFGGKIGECRYKETYKLFNVIMKKYIQSERGMDFAYSVKFSIPEDNILKIDIELPALIPPSANIVGPIKHSVITEYIEPEKISIDMDKRTIVISGVWGTSVENLRHPPVKTQYMTLKIFF